MTGIALIPEDIQHLYQIHDWRHAAAILAIEFPEEFSQACEALRQFRFKEEDITKAGGNESAVPKLFSQLLRPAGWRESKMTAQLVVDGQAVNSDTHKVDYLKGEIAFDVEWNGKDQTFDRDLLAFRTFFDYGKISLGIIVTRSNELDPYFASLGTYTDPSGRVRRYMDKYGASTTHMGKLLPRLTAGRSGGCPVLAFGITPRLLEEAAYE